MPWQMKSSWILERSHSLHLLCQAVHKKWPEYLYLQQHNSDKLKSHKPQIPSSFIYITTFNSVKTACCSPQHGQTKVSKVSIKKVIWKSILRSMTSRHIKIDRIMYLNCTFVLHRSHNSMYPNRWSIWNQGRSSQLHVALLFPTPQNCKATNCSANHKKLPRFYRTQRLTTVFTAACLFSVLSQMKTVYILPLPPTTFKAQLNVIFLSMLTLPRGDHD